MRAHFLSAAFIRSRTATTAIIAIVSFLIAVGTRANDSSSSEERTSPGNLPRLVVQTTHSTMVADFVYNRDSTLLATLGGDGVIKVWNTESGKEILTIAGYPFRGVAFHPHDDVVAAIESGNVIRLFDARTGGQLKRLADSKLSSKKVGSEAFMFFMQNISLAYSSDGSLLVNGGQDGVLVWRADNGELHRNLSKKTRVDTFDVSPDGDVVATIVDGNVIRLYSTSSGKKVRDIPAKVGRVTTLKFSADASSLVIGSDAGTIRLFDRQTGSEIGEPPLYNSCDRPYEIISKTSRFKAFGSIAKAIGGDSVRNAIGLGEKAQGIGETIGETCRHVKMASDAMSAGLMAFVSPGGIRSLALGVGGDRLAYQLGSNTVRVMDVATKSTLYEIDPRGQFRLWAPEDAEPEQQESMDAAFQLMAPPALKFSTDGNTLNTISEFKTVARWDAQSGEKISSLAVSTRDLSMGFPFPFPRGSVPVFGIDGKTLLTATLTAGTKMWDLERGAPPQLVSDLPALLNSPAVSPDSRLTVASEPSGAGPAYSIVVREIGSGREVQRFETRESGPQPQHPMAMEFLATFAPDSKRIALQTMEEGLVWLRVYEIETAVELYSTDGVRNVTFSADGKLMALRDEEYDIRVVDTASWNDVFKAKTKAPINGFFGGETIFSADSKRLAAVDDDTIKIWNLAGKKVYRKKSVSGSDLSNLVFSPDKDILTYTTKRNLYHWNFETDDTEISSVATDFWGNLAYSPDGRLLALGGAENRVRLFDVDSDTEIGSLVVPSEDDWLVVTPEGRLDTRWLENVADVHWVIHSEPYVSQPLELFMREYYEPQLLPKLVRGEVFAPLPDLTSRNRTLPKVEITNVAESGQDRIKVDVLVTETVSQTQTDLEGKPLRSGAAGLRLLRNGRLVGHAPSDFSTIDLDGAGSKTVSFDVQLPKSSSDGTVDLTAYAFNKDRVKSLTARRVHSLNSTSGPAAGRAYIISVGVNTSDDPGFNLAYAANDARLVLETLSSQVLRTGRYREAIEIPLISDDASFNAIKPNVKGVFDLLAGRPVELSQQQMDQISAGGKVQKTTPEDLVLFTFAGHGYTEPGGIFYFVPSDIGVGFDGTIDSIRDQLISSEMLSEWLIDVDAGELLMVVDACYSAGIVEAQNFKPGPLGSRGLGQLSYDKGMRILAATQANDVALELAELQHGMLTYALVADGIQRRQADFRPIDNRVMTAEWLQYAVDRVPELYREAMHGEINTFENGEPVNADRAAEVLASQVGEEQQPVVFDFSRRTEGTVLVNYE